MTTFCILTAGCAANQADSEQMAGLLKEAQFRPVNSLEEADLVIFNTCTVKTPSETNFFKELKQVRDNYPYKIVIVAGCIAQTNPHKLKEYALIGTKQIHRIVQVVEEALHDNLLKNLSNEENPPLSLPRVRKNPVIEILPVSRGCLGACTFCKTKKARGNLISYSIEEILKEAKKAIREGVKEIWLTSQDTFCYGFDQKTDLPALLAELVKLEGDFKIRIGMGNPDHLLKIKERLLPFYKHSKVFKFLHLPLQAGHDDVLRAMQRNYTVNDFLQLVEEFKKESPNLNLMTDLIVGYPCETDDHYWGTLEVVRKTTPDSVNISRFWPRPGTLAGELKELSGEILKHRSKVLADIFRNISQLNNEKMLGWEGEILIDEKNEGQWVGRTDTYKPVYVYGDFKFGDLVKVKVFKATTFGLRGKVI